MPAVSQDGGAVNTPDPRDEGPGSPAEVLLPRPPVQPGCSQGRGKHSFKL